MTAPSPHYVVRDRKRHSLYGTDDRVVLDLGSACWKVGFSGEVNPRRVLFARPADAPAPAGIWEVEFEDVGRGDGRATRWWQRWETWEGLDVLDGKGDGTEAGSAEPDEEALDAPALREVGEEMVDLRIGDLLRDVFDHHLMTDPKSRKVIVLENPLLPTRIKEMIARRLFEDFQVPSISFFPPQLLALLATGRTTGLVVDVGHLETVVLPIHLSRPLYPLLASSPLANRHLLRTLYILLLHFGAFVPPVATLSAAAALGGPRGRAREATRIPRAALQARGVLNRILNEGCFVGPSDDLPRSTSAVSEPMEIDPPPSEGQMATADDLNTGGLDEPLPPLPPHLVVLHARFARASSARPLRLAVPASVGEGLAGGTIIVPGWIRERVAEELVAESAADGRRERREEEGVVELVLGVLEKLPIDLRVPLASSILVTGGTAHLPGFIPRLRASLLASLRPSDATTTSTSTGPLPRRRPESSHPHQPILALRKHVAILNDPTPEAVGSAGSAPAFAPSLLAWVGGSLAGSLRAGAKGEVTRERWDDAREVRRKRFASAARVAGEAEGQPAGSERDEEVEWEAEQWTRAGGVEVLGDWTRNSLGGPAQASGLSAGTGPLATATAAGGGGSRR